MTQPLLRQTDPLDGFILPRELEAGQPPEMRGLARDAVRLLVVEGGESRHMRFSQIEEVLQPGDLLVVNNSRTLPAAIDVDESTIVHFSTELPGGLRVIEVRHRTETGSRPNLTMRPGSLDLPGGATLELLAPFPIDSTTRRLWAAHVDTKIGFCHLLKQHGRPISYTSSPGSVPLSEYQTVFARKPGSAEMPSAGRPFSRDLVTELVSSGVGIVPLTLHTGVSSLESGEPPYPEWFSVPAGTAGTINEARRRGGRVIAVGTTVVRAMETVTDSSGRVQGGSGWTDLVIEADHRVRSIDGMITGWHEPRSTHLDMLVAVAGRDIIAHSYEEALAEGYLWHEFGDSHLIVRT